MDVAYLLLDAKPTPGERPLPPPRPEDGGSLLRPFVHSPPQPNAQAAHAGAHAARAGLHAALHPREALERSRSLAGLIVRDELIGRLQLAGRGVVVLAARLQMLLQRSRETVISMISEMPS